MAKYSQIVFLTGDDYPAFEAELHKSLNAGMRYLAQWDNGDDYDIRDNSSAGMYDDFHYFDLGDFEYLMTWNYALGYASLQRIIHSN